MRKNLMRNAVVAASVAAIGATGLLAGAGAAEAGPLKSGSKITRGLDGESVSIKRAGESSRIIGSTANNGASRGAVLSGVYTSKFGGGVSGKQTLYVIVGCQIDISGLTLDLGVGVDLTGSGSASASLTVPLTPGQAVLVKVDDKSIGENGKGSIQIAGFPISVSGCGGYASARSVAVAEGAKGYEISDDADVVVGEGTFLKSTLYGQPFSLG